MERQKEAGTTSLFVESVEKLEAHAQKLKDMRAQGAAGGAATVGGYVGG